MILTLRVLRTPREPVVNKAIMSHSNMRRIRDVVPYILAPPVCQETHLEEAEQFTKGNSPTPSITYPSLLRVVVQQEELPTALPCLEVLSTGAIRAKSEKAWHNPHCRNSQKLRLHR